MFIIEANVCASKLREWLKKGGNVLLLDLKKLYFQIRIEESLAISNNNEPREDILPDATGI